MTKQNQTLPRKELVFLDKTIDKIRNGETLNMKDAQDAEECGFTLTELTQLVGVIYAEDSDTTASE